MVRYPNGKHWSRRCNRAFLDHKLMTSHEMARKCNDLLNKRDLYDGTKISHRAVEDLFVYKEKHHYGNTYTWMYFYARDYHIDDDLLIRLKERTRSYERQLSKSLKRNKPSKTSHSKDKVTLSKEGLSEIPKETRKGENNV